MAARALRRTIICITPNQGDLIDHKFYSEIYGPEFNDGQDIPLLVEFNVNHYQVFILKIKLSFNLIFRFQIK